GHSSTQKTQNDAPGEYRAQAAHDRAISDVVPEHSPGKLDDRRLDQKRQRRVRKGKIAIRNIAERYAVRVFENVTNIQKYSELRVLPHYDSYGSEKQEPSFDPVGPHPAFRAGWSLGYVACAHLIARAHGRRWRV